MISKKKEKILDKYAKMIQCLKREYQTVYTEKKQIERFFKKTRRRQEKRRAKIAKKTTCQTNKHLQQNDCSTKKKTKH